jgi:hypothetical protein
MNRVRKKHTNEAAEQPKRMSWLIVFSLLSGALAAYVIIQGSLVQAHDLGHILFWMAGAATIGFSLLRMFPRHLPLLFQGMGCVSIFTIAVMVGSFAHNGEFPSLRGSINSSAFAERLEATTTPVESFAKSVHHNSTTFVSNVYGFIHASLMDRDEAES